MPAPNLTSARTAAGNRLAAARASGKTSAGSLKIAGKSIAGTSAKSMAGAGTMARHATVTRANRTVRRGQRIARAGRFAAVTWWWSVKVASRLRARRLGARRPLVVNATAPQLTAAAAGGAGLALLLDPNSGKRRRRIMVDRGMALSRRALRRGVKKADFAAGKAQGAVHEATSTPTTPDDDQTLADKVRTEIFRRDDAPKGAVNVSAVNGIVYLRGEVADAAEIERLVSDTLAVPGVLRVENLLHTPGTPAPTGGAG